MYKLLLSALALFALALPLAAEPVVGGDTSPDGTVQVQCDLPSALRMHNVGGRDGAGLCVFTSITHSARYQSERALFDFQKQMRSELGGGWPEKVDRMIAKYAPGVEYLQHTGGDMRFLEAALKTGRMPGVTYDGHDPHYGNQTIGHMVNLVALTNHWAAILDNNFPNELVWMTPDEFKQRWTGGGGDGWAVVLLAPAPTPPPHNRADALRNGHYWNYTWDGNESQRFVWFHGYPVWSKYEGRWDESRWDMHFLKYLRDDNDQAFPVIGSIGQCPNCQPSFPVAPTPPPVAFLEWKPSANPDQLVLWFGDIQKGNWVKSEGKYYERLGPGCWATTPSEPPILPPADATEQNFGVDRSRIHPTSPYVLNGQPADRAEAFAALLRRNKDDDTLPTDADTPFLTAIGTESETAAFVASLPAEVKAAVRLHTYLPTDPLVSGLGFPAGAPAVFLQDASGAVEAWWDKAPTSTDLLTGLRRLRDPNFQPKAPGLPSILSSMLDLAKVEAWVKDHLLLLAIVGAVLFFLLRSKGTPSK